MDVHEYVIKTVSYIIGCSYIRFSAVPKLTACSFIRYSDMIYLLTATGLTPGVSSTVQYSTVQYTFTNST
jgi:hypothetical protein